MEELDQNVGVFIDSIQITHERNFNVMKRSSWTDKSAKMHDIFGVHELFASRAVSDANKLYKMVEGNVTQKRVETMLKLLIDIVNTHCNNIEQYITDNDWSIDLLSDGEISVNSKTLKEAEFQTEILKSKNAHKFAISGINLSGEVKGLNIVMFRDEKVTIPMKKALMAAYPEIAEYLKHRFNEKV